MVYLNFDSSKWHIRSETRDTVVVDYLDTQSKKYSARVAGDLSLKTLAPDFPQASREELVTALKHIALFWADSSDATRG